MPALSKHKAPDRWSDPTLVEDFPQKNHATTTVIERAKSDPTLVEDFPQKNHATTTVIERAKRIRGAEYTTSNQPPPHAPGPTPPRQSRNQPTSMSPFSKHNTNFSSFAVPWLTCALTLCLTACNGPGGGSDPAEREPVSQTSESDDESKPDSRMDAEDDESTNDETESADSHDSEEDEEGGTPVARSCRTLDDCAEGQVCVLKRGDGFCELGVAEARGPLGQPPPPVGLVEGGVNFDGEGAE